MCKIQFLITSNLYYVVDHKVTYYTIFHGASLFLELRCLFNTYTVILTFICRLGNSFTVIKYCLLEAINC